MATEEEIITAAQLAMKLQLEAQIKPPLERFFSQIGKDIAVVWTATQSIPSIFHFQPELVSLLRGYYRKVARKFDGELVDRINNDKLHNALLQDRRVNNKIVNYINQHSTVQANTIMETTQRDLQNVVSKQLISVAVNGELTTDYQIGKAIQKSFEASTDARVETIAITETQIASERMKFIETQGVMQLANELVLPHVFTKSWGAILDEKTREAHVLADGQRQNVNAPFNVGGQLIMVPGDMTLGAGFANVVNCRCCSVVTFDEDASQTE